MNFFAWDRIGYVNNNPINYNDPSGHFGILNTGAIGGAIGGAIYGFGSQVANNLQQGMNFGEALTTNISGETVGFYTLVGAGIGTVDAPLVAPLASSIAGALTTSTTASTVTGGGVQLQQPYVRMGIVQMK